MSVGSAHGERGFVDLGRNFHTGNSICSSDDDWEIGSNSSDESLSHAEKVEQAALRAMEKMRPESAFQEESSGKISISKTEIETKSGLSEKTEKLVLQDKSIEKDSPSLSQRFRKLLKISNK